MSSTKPLLIQKALGLEYQTTEQGTISEFAFTQLEPLIERITEKPTPKIISSTEEASTTPLSFN